MVGCKHKEAALGKVVGTDGVLAKVVGMEPVAKAPPGGVEQCWLANGDAFKLQRCCWWCSMVASQGWEASTLVGGSWARGVGAEAQSRAGSRPRRSAGTY